jgi:hypothetical protein
VLAYRLASFILRRKPPCLEIRSLVGHRAHLYAVRKIPHSFLELIIDTTVDNILFIESILTCISIARERQAKHVPRRKVLGQK